MIFCSSDSKYLQQFQVFRLGKQVFRQDLYLILVEFEWLQLGQVVETPNLEVGQLIVLQHPEMSM